MNLYERTAVFLAPVGSHRTENHSVSTGDALDSPR